MAETMRIRAQWTPERTTIRILMHHDMESGQRKDVQGRTIPAWFIQEVAIGLNGRPVLQAQFGPSMAKNPFLQFHLKGGKVGDKLSVTWRDNRGATRTQEAALA
jgi:sulfur-oxidizing protein SoxZ